MNNRAYSPRDARGRSFDFFPDELFAVVNEHLARNIGQPVIELTQAKFTEELEALGVSEEELFDNGWLEFEGAYRNAGWHVEGYPRTDSYEPHWTFVPMS